MRICLVSDARLPVRLYGGTERIVQWLADHLQRLGHSVVLVAQPGSSLPGVQVVPATRTHEALARIPRDADIVHFHAWAPPDDFDRPWVFTLHGNEPPGTRLPRCTVGISADHARRHGLAHHVYNGVEPDELRYEPHKQDHLLFFSKVRRRVKGAARAIHLARSHGVRLEVAGGFRLDLLKTGGFLQSLHPFVRFHGEIGGQRKADCLARARALLFPIAWDEPFGLVLVEAMLSGTPVLATPRGSVPELVPPQAGVLFERDEEFGSALERLEPCRPADARDWAMAHFTAHDCARRYLALYERVLDGEDLFGTP